MSVDGSSAAEQALHALRIYRRTGGWGHCGCKPDGARAGVVTR
jgi:hypothetical protein